MVYSSTSSLPTTYSEKKTCYIFSITIIPFYCPVLSSSLYFAQTFPTFPVSFNVTNVVWEYTRKYDISAWKGWITLDISWFFLCLLPVHNIWWHLFFVSKVLQFFVKYYIGLHPISFAAVIVIVTGAHCVFRLLHFPFVLLLFATPPSQFMEYNFTATERKNIIECAIKQIVCWWEWL